MTEAPRDTYESRLQALRDELEERLRSTVEQSKPVDLGEPIGRLSRMDAMQQQNMAETQRRRDKQQLARIKAALSRIAQGTYGECLRCGEPIDPARLQIKPEATLCRDCQQGME